MLNGKGLEGLIQHWIFLSIGDKIIKNYYRVALFIAKKDAPLWWVEDIQTLMLSCYPNEAESSAPRLNHHKVGVVINSLGDLLMAGSYANLDNNIFKPLKTPDLRTHRPLIERFRSQGSLI